MRSLSMSMSATSPHERERTPWMGGRPVCAKVSVSTGATEPLATAKAALATSQCSPAAWRSDMATALPDPAGSTPSGVRSAAVASARELSACTTSASSPSPETTTMPSTAASSIAATSRPACPAPVVTVTSDAMPASSKIGRASFSHADTAPPAPPAGLMKTRTRRPPRDGSCACTASTSLSATPGSGTNTRRCTRRRSQAPRHPYLERG
mmetsp:Transcript_5161/g.18024  ORF Transcript_5161/g.18024 Transcript_5161/m.18024 type:complete len:210 (-) Transcript_5161:70-699(-)